MMKKKKTENFFLQITKFPIRIIYFPVGVTITKLGIYKKKIYLSPSVFPRLGNQRPGTLNVMFPQPQQLPWV